MTDENDIEIKGMLESSFLDWDGKIVATLYLPNCNFKCPFCHNWELIETPEKFDTIPIVEIVRHLISNQDFLDDVCITGGEPTIYSGLPGLIEQIREIGLSVKLDTNGTNPDVLLELMDDGLINYIAMDVKAPLDERYNKLAGCKVDIEVIKESINIIMNSKLDYEFRTTVVPKFLTQEDISALVSQIAGAKKYVFQQFVPKNARNAELRKTTPYPNDLLRSMQKLAENEIKSVTIRGLK